MMTIPAKLEPYARIRLIGLRMGFYHVSTGISASWNMHLQNVLNKKIGKRIGRTGKYAFSRGR